MKLPLTQNASYKAVAKLSGFMALAASAVVIQAKLKQFGFTNVQVTGSGANWTATGTWAKPSQEVTLPNEIVEFNEI